MLSLSQLATSGEKLCTQHVSNPPAAHSAGRWPVFLPVLGYFGIILWTAGMPAGRGAAGGVQQREQAFSGGFMPESVRMTKPTTLAGHTHTHGHLFRVRVVRETDCWLRGRPAGGQHSQRAMVKCR